VTGNALTLDPITQDPSADDSGTATWARFVDGDGNGVIDVDVSDTTGNGFVKLNTTQIVVNGPISISSCVINF
jgi:purine nucleoside permease